MQKRITGYLLLIVGLVVMGFAGYLFATGTGGRGNLLEVVSYLIVGAVCFFAGINYIYVSDRTFTVENINPSPELDEVTDIQQQWRTIHITKQQPQTVKQASTRLAEEIN